MRIHTWFALTTVIMLVPLGRLPAQDTQAPDAPDPPVLANSTADETAAPAPTASEAATAALAEFERILTEFRAMLADFGTLQLEYRSASEDERAEIKKQWEQLVEKGDAMEPKLLTAAEKAYVEAPNANREVTNLLQEVMVKHLQDDDYENAARLGKLLVDNQCEEKRVANVAGLAAFAVNNLDDAEKYLKQAQKDGVFTPFGIDLLDNLVAGFLNDPATMKEAWAKEQQIRDAEAKADDLPRVLLKTNKGDIEIELFENEAPIAVGNFVSLVEKGFYNGLTFHRVLAGFMAQGGCPTGDGTGGPGYNIPCECYEPNHRLHFRGTLSMAHAGRDTGGSQFFLTFLPTKHLDGMHTVFGRVIKGFEVLAKLQRRDPAAFSPPEADKIIEATVIRKRDHEYAPTKVGQ